MFCKVFVLLSLLFRWLLSITGGSSMSIWSNSASNFPLIAVPDSSVLLSMASELFFRAAYGLLMLTISLSTLPVLLNNTSGSDSGSGSGPAPHSSTETLR